MRKGYLKNIIVLLIALVSMIPSLILCRYTYPVQDDFHYAYHARLLFEEGHNLFSMAWAKTVEYYLTFTGCYTSSFLGHFFSGIIQCEPEGIQWFCFISMICFYIALYLCVLGITKYIFNINSCKVNYIYCLLILCFTGLIYFAESEDYYWFITSVQYLLITTFILIGVYLYIKGLYTDKKAYLLGAGVMGFLGAGGALNIAAMCFLFMSIIMLWGVFTLKKKKPALITWEAVLIGGIINGIAPGNYIRYGSPVTSQKVLAAIIDSCRYALWRVFEYYFGNQIFVFILIALVIGLLLWKPTGVRIKCRFPISFTIMGFATIAITIFPVMLGYGWDTYLVICRSNFISDLVIFFMIFVILLYWRCWLYSHSEKIIIPRKIGIVTLFCFTIFACAVLYKHGTKPAFYRQVTELQKGLPQEYAAYWIDVYEEIEESEDTIVVLHRENIAEDKTCLIDPQFAVGEYDYANSPLNRSIAQFYGKEAVFLFLQEEDSN